MSELWNLSEVNISFCMQEAGRLHLRRCCFKLHGWEGWRLQAGDHRQRQSVCNHRIRHRSAEGLTLETAHWPGSAAVPRRRWAQIIIHKSSLHTHPLRLSFIHFPCCLSYCMRTMQLAVCAVSAGKWAHREELISCRTARNLWDMIISITLLHTSYLYTDKHTHHDGRWCGVNFLTPLRA